MISFVVAPAAERDLKQIYGYITSHSVRNADRGLARFLQQFDSIGKMPGIGHRRPELNDPSLRVSSVYKYLVIYDATRRPVEILRIIHGAMDLQREFSKRR